MKKTFRLVLSIILLLLVYSCKTTKEKDTIEQTNEQIPVVEEIVEEKEEEIVEVVKEVEKLKVEEAREAYIEREDTVVSVIITADVYGGVEEDESTNTLPETYFKVYLDYNPKGQISKITYLLLDLEIKNYLVLHYKPISRQFIDIDFFSPRKHTRFYTSSFSSSGDIVSMNIRNKLKSRVGSVIFRYYKTDNGSFPTAIAYTTNDNASTVLAAWAFSYDELYRISFYELFNRDYYPHNEKRQFKYHSYLSSSFEKLADYFIPYYDDAYKMRAVLDKVSISNYAGERVGAVSYNEDIGLATVNFVRRNGTASESYRFLTDINGNITNILVINMPLLDEVNLKVYSVKEESRFNIENGRVKSMTRFINNVAEYNTKCYYDTKGYATNESVFNADNKLFIRYSWDITYR